MSTRHLTALFGGELKPLVRFEMTTHALRMRCSTPELQRQMLCAATAYHTTPTNASLFSKKVILLLFFLKKIYYICKRTKNQPNIVWK